MTNIGLHHGEGVSVHDPPDIVGPDLRHKVHDHLQRGPVLHKLALPHHSRRFQPNFVFRHYVLLDQLPAVHCVNKWVFKVEKSVYLKYKKVSIKS